MIKVILLLVLPFFLYASKILNYNIYDRTDRVDIMLTFDTPYSGIIKQSSSRSKIVITLDDVTIEAPKSKKIASKYLQSISIVPLQNTTQIIATVPNQNITLHASKTTDGYGLRLRFTKGTSLKKKEQVVDTAEPSLSILPTKKEDNISQSYIIVITIMVIGVFILLYLKRKIQQPTTPSSKRKKGSWLFQSTNAAPTAAPETTKENVSIRFQKAINEDNSVVMLDFGAQSYLVLMGKSNILLDKFTDEKPTSQREFESILQSRHEQLESFLSDTDNATLDKKISEPLQSYKERAATLLYNENQ